MQCPPRILAEGAKAKEEEDSSSDDSMMKKRQDEETAAKVKMPESFMSAESDERRCSFRKEQKRVSFNEIPHETEEFIQEELGVTAPHTSATFDFEGSPSDCGGSGVLATMEDLQIMQNNILQAFNGLISAHRKKY